MLSYVFETLGMETVGFKVNEDNLASQNAVLRLGAKLVEVLKKFKTMPNKKTCDYFHYTITSADWPEIKKNHLQAKLATTA